MDAVIGSSLIDAGSGLLGGIFGGSKGTSLRDMNKQAEVNYNWAGKQFDQAMQKADQYGIHKLTMLGTGFQNAQNPVGMVSGDSSRDRWSNITAGVSRAVQAVQSKEDRALNLASAKLQLENQQLQNDRLASENALLQQPGSPPGFNRSPAMVDQGDSPSLVEYGPNEVSAVGKDGKEGGPISSWNIAKTRFGDMRVPSKDIQDRMEEIPLAGWEWFIRNKLLGNIFSTSTDAKRSYSSRRRYHR